MSSKSRLMLYALSSIPKCVSENLAVKTEREGRSEVGRLNIGRIMV